MRMGLKLLLGEQLFFQLVAWSDGNPAAPPLLCHQRDAGKTEGLNITVDGTPGYFKFFSENRGRLSCPGSMGDEYAKQAVQLHDCSSFSMGCLNRGKRKKQARLCRGLFPVPLKFHFFLHIGDQLVNGMRTCSMLSRSRTVTQLSADFSPSPTVSKSTVMHRGVPISS